MKKFSLVYTIIFLLLFSFEGFSIPRFALRMGGTCADCHIDPTGGGLRSDGGFNFERNVLPMMKAEKSIQTGDKIGDNIIFGLDYRTQYLYSQQFGKTDFQRMQGNIYTDVNLTDKLDIYGSYDFVNNTWEGYGIAHILPNDSYIKVGSFRPNFGVMIDDHTAYTRGGDLGYIFSGRSYSTVNLGLIYDPRYTETGLEVGANLPDHIFLTASVASPRTPSQLFFSDPTYTARIQYTPIIANELAVMVGGSFATFKGEIAPFFTPNFPKVTLYGGFLGFGLTDFTLIGEYDIASDYLQEGTKSAAAMLEGSYQLMKGLETFVRYDRFDPNTSVSSDEVQRIVAGVDVYPYSFIEIIPEYRFQFETPSVKNDSFVLQFHFFY
jgi:hypothetical protein